MFLDEREKVDVFGGGYGVVVISVMVVPVVVEVR